jgi:hypothetical protein
VVLKSCLSTGNPAKLLTGASKKLAFDDTQKQDSIDDMVSADNLAFLALTSYKFNGGEK